MNGYFIICLLPNKNRTIVKYAISVFSIILVSLTISKFINSSDKRETSQFEPIKSQFEPIQFNVSGDSLKLVFKAKRGINDTFCIETDKKVEYLKEALVSHYKFASVIREQEKTNDNDYEKFVYKSYLFADKEKMENEELSLLEAGIKNFDVIEIKCDKFYYNQVLSPKKEAMSPLKKKN